MDKLKLILSWVNILVGLFALVFTPYLIVFWGILLGIYFVPTTAGLIIAGFLIRKNKLIGWYISLAIFSYYILASIYMYPVIWYMYNQGLSLYMISHVLFPPHNLLIATALLVVEFIVFLRKRSTID